MSNDPKPPNMWQILKQDLKDEADVETPEHIEYEEESEGGEHGNR